MRVIFFGNNWVGWQQLLALRQQPCELVALVVHPEDRSRFRRHHLIAAGLPPQRVFDATRLRESETLAALAELRPDMGFCGCFGYILRPELLQLFPKGCVNSHISMLPYNRGAFPNVWSIIEGTPAGVSLHYIDPGVDTGDLLAQRHVPVDAADTGQSLYLKLERAAVELFREACPAILSGILPAKKQDHSAATVHKVADAARIDEVQLDRAYLGRDLLNLLRARTFPPFKGAYFVENGRRIYLRLHLEPDHSP